VNSSSHPGRRSEARSVEKNYEFLPQGVSEMRLVMFCSAGSNLRVCYFNPSKLQNWFLSKTSISDHFLDSNLLQSEFYLSPNFNEELINSTRQSTNSDRGYKLRT
jgi:hypothetical protein